MTRAEELEIREQFIKLNKKEVLTETQKLLQEDKVLQYFKRNRELKKTGRLRE